MQNFVIKVIILIKYCNVGKSDNFSFLERINKAYMIKANLKEKYRKQTRHIYKKIISKRQLEDCQNN